MRPRCSRHPRKGRPVHLEARNRAVFPQQWLRPRIKWTGTTGLHQVTLRSAGQEGELVAYTTGSSVTLPRALWTNLAAHTVNQDIEVTVRAAAGGESHRASNRSGGRRRLDGVLVGQARRGRPRRQQYRRGLRLRAARLQRGRGIDRASAANPAGAAGQRRPGGNPAPVRCIGCHVATPDDGFVAFVDDWPWNLAVAGVNPASWAAAARPVGRRAGGAEPALGRDDGVLAGVLGAAQAAGGAGFQPAELRPALVHRHPRPGQAALVQPDPPRPWPACWPTDSNWAR